MEYAFRDIESKWQRLWKERASYKVSNHSGKPKFFVQDMFPYPSGAGLHVGHPLGFIASDIIARYKRLKGFEVLHPMGFDAFGLPAEQYAIETGQHPAVTTAQNISNFKEQLEKIGFSFDWSREVNTSDPKFYKWTQWIFLQLFHSWFNRTLQRAEPISDLIGIFTREGNSRHPSPGNPSLVFSAREWASFGDRQKHDILMDYRLAYCGIGEVNWCEALGTVLANDEVIGGFSERGGYPVVRKKLRQWYMRITEYADRLLEGLTRVDFSQAMKDMQTNWIGRSEGAEIRFPLKVPGREDQGPSLLVFTTRPDTLFGVDFMVVAPEHELVPSLVTASHREQVEHYLEFVRNRSERERMAEKGITGVETGALAVNPFNGREVPVWISEYVLAGYGTGAIMAVPCGDERDHRFAKHFGIPITNIIGTAYAGDQANPTKAAILENSGFMNGLVMSEAIAVALRELEEKGLGRRQVHYKMRDAAFSRQRYWGEPIPIIWKDGIAYPLSEKDLPLELPHVDHYRPGPEGEGPLANIPEWTGRHLETNTMPGYAGSSWYFLRYMDPDNEQEFCSREASDYWGQVDLYVGGTEHAVGHLLYSRMWNKILYDLGYIGQDEPYKKLVNQGMIQGSSRFVYRRELDDTFLSLHQQDAPVDSLRATRIAMTKDIPAGDGNNPENHPGKITPLHVDVNIVDGVKLRVKEFRDWKPEFKDAVLILDNGMPSTPFSDPGADNGDYICGSETEKMSKSKYNTVNPNDIVQRYGADTFRMYEMFLGPLELSKPWDTQGIEGVHRFLKKFWRLFYSEAGDFLVTDDPPSPEEMRILHRTIKKVGEDTEKLFFNTAVSQFMISVNELGSLHGHSRAILEPMLILLCPYAPHISSELWEILGHQDPVLVAPYPVYQPQYLKEDQVHYPVAINGKTRTQMSFPAGTDPAEIQRQVLDNEVVRKWLEEKPPKKVIVVPGRMVNVVL